MGYTTTEKEIRVKAMELLNDGTCSSLVEALEMAKEAVRQVASRAGRRVGEESGEKGQEEKAPAPHPREEVAEGELDEFWTAGRSEAAANPCARREKTKARPASSAQRSGGVAPELGRTRPRRGAGPPPLFRARPAPQGHRHGCAKSGPSRGTALARSTRGEVACEPRSREGWVRSVRVGESDSGRPDF